VIGLPAVFVAVAIGTTFSVVTTYTVLPSGVTAKVKGSKPMLMGLPGSFVATLIGVTELPPSAT
jgi:hypothetical protein